LQHVEFCKAKLEELGTEAIRPEPFVRGRDLIAMGYEPGPHFTKMLEVVETAQLDGEVQSREDAEAWIRARYPLPGR
jgi:poly(A) polymerase